MREGNETAVPTYTSSIYLRDSWKVYRKDTTWEDFSVDGI
jgi:hypothetical protein